MPNPVTQPLRRTITGPVFSASRWTTAHQLQTRHVTYRFVPTVPVSFSPTFLNAISSRRPRFTAKGDDLSSRRLNFTTMPARKRKADQVAQDVADIVPIVEQASSARRSARRKSQKPTYNDDASGDEIDGLAVAVGQAPAVVATAVKQEDEYEPETIDVPVRKHIKRQKVKVEQVTVEADVKGIVIAAAKQPATPAKGKGQKKKPALPTPEKDESGDALDDDYVQAADEPEMAEEIVAERGAKRPPAVNSSYLPLPWKGRLGYVRAFMISSVCGFEANIR